MATDLVKVEHLGNVRGASVLGKIDTVCRLDVGFIPFYVELTHWFSAKVSEMSIIIPRIQDSLSLSLSLSLSIGGLENDIPT